MAEPRRDRAERWLVGLGLATLVLCVTVVATLVVPVVDSVERTTPQAAVPPTEDSAPGPEVPPHGVLAGVVTDDRGRPVEDVVINASSEQSGQQGSTDRHGRYRMVVPTGSYRVSFGGPGGASYALEFHPDAPTADLAESVEVEAGAETVVDAEVRPGARLSGRVVGGPGRPVDLRHRYDEAAVVEAWLPTRKGRRWTAMEPAAVDGDGQWALAGLPPGRYRVRFDHPRIGTVYHPSATRPGVARRLRLAPGEHRAGVDVRLPPPATLSGRVLTAAGAPVPGVGITVWSGTHAVRAGTMAMWRMSDPRSTTTDQDGRYAIGGLGSGTYQVRPGERPAGDALVRSPCGALRTETVRVDAGRSATRDLRAVPRAPLSGAVTGQDGSPLPAITVRVRSVDGSGCDGRVRTDAAGRYWLGLFTGRYRVHFQPRRRGPSTMFLPEHHDDAQRRREAATVRLDPTGARVDAALTEGGRVSGRLTTLDGTPVTGVDLRLLGPAWPRRGTTGTDRRGRFGWEGVPAEPAVVSVELSLRGHPLDALRRYLADDLVTLDRERAMQVEVDSGEHLRLGTIRLDLGGGITGVVRNRRGRPVPFAWVAAHRQESDGTWREVANDPAGRGGRYRVRGLPEGVYRLEVRRRVLQPDGSRLSADQLRIDSDQVVDGVDLVVGGG